ncbi:MAG: beta-N-acetylglucosaminidase [Flavobacteriaceae bacterium]|nr:MAG: beta-N-acetylglucosaminidase [Flavobacteriaceae bacterium]
MKLKLPLFSLFFTVFSLLITAQSIDPLVTKDAKSQQKWVDDLMNNMTIDQKIGQLFMVAAYSNKGSEHANYIHRLIDEYEIGGLIFMQGTPRAQAKLNNSYQKKSKIPLLIGFDGEWGLDMRLKNTYRYPWNMTLGAIRDDRLIEEFGKQLGKHCKRLGIHINFAPVVDVNTNPNNPIIGNRSFGENKLNVAAKAIAFTKGMQGEGVLANAKHFPGHGDTATDSHKTLPVVDFTKERIESVELYPYKELFKNGLTSIMAAHLSVPSLEPNPGLPSSLSYNIITNILQKDLGFKGLIITDALNMKGAANFAEPGDIDLAALLAGNDVLLFPENIGIALSTIRSAITEKILTEERLDVSVRKILMAKYWAGLHQMNPVVLAHLNEDLNTIEDQLLHKKLVENSTSLLKNNGNIFPIQQLDKKRIAYVKFGDSNSGAYLKMLRNYTDITVVKGKTIDVILEKLKAFNLVIIGAHKSNKNPWKSFKFKSQERYWMQEIARNNPVILNVFTSPYSLLDFKTFENFEGILACYQNSKISQEVAAQMIFGVTSTKGKLPVSIRNDFSEGHGLMSSSLQRLGYAIPEEVGMDQQVLNQIDGIAKEVLAEKMAPGMQVLVARKGKVIFHKAYGYHTDKKVRRVRKDDVYDLASLTKILGGLPMIMRSEELGKFTLDNTLGEIMPILRGSNKDTVTIREALSHVGKLKAWIPFYLKTIDSVTKLPSLKYYRDTKSKKFPIKVARGLYLRADYIDTIYKRIVEIPQREKSGYRYSGLPFYLFKKYVEDTYSEKMDVLNTRLFYKPLGANSLMYNPLEKIAKSKIVPTENDDYYRHQLLQGYVHDMGAAMLNGVSGNAGLFGNANDIAKLMQMYLQKGFYGGKRFFKASTLEKFTRRHYEKDSIRRGLGFDKPQMDPEGSSTCGCVSSKSFGHSGFTGTFAWADPVSEIVYVFLSNRVYPKMNNYGLVKKGIRTRVQQIIQDAITDDKEQVLHIKSNLENKKQDNTSAKALQKQLK